MSELNKQFILDCMKTIGISDDNRGKQTSEDKIKNKETKKDIKLFYDNTFKIVNEKISYSNKTYIF